MANRKVIIIGLDGLDPNILEGLMARGEMPNFVRLAREGSFSFLETVNPPQSPVVWTTIATGQTPAGHGIYDFLTRDPGGYLPRLAILQQGKLGYQRPFAPDAFWDLASIKGIPCSIIKWPVTFPATPLTGNLLSGLGTPDMRGSLGRYTFFTTRDLPEPERLKGALVKLNATSGAIQTHIAGPFKFSFQGAVETTAPLEINLDEGRLSGLLDGAPFTLEEGCWSPWLRLTFKVGFLRSIGGMVRFYLESLKPDLNLYMTPINFDHDTKSPPLSYPSGYAGQLAQVVGPYATLGLAEDANALNEGLISEPGFLAGCDAILSERERMFGYELARFHQGILAVVFDSLDRIQHMLWRYLDEGHPRHDAAAAQRYAGIMAHYYRWMDRILGMALAKADGRTLLVVCSDHGFTTFRRMIHLNTWLVQNGFMALRQGCKAGREMFADVDWSRTVAFAFGLNSLFLNIRGREQQGALAPEDAGRALARLTARLGEFSDQGRPVLRQVHDPVALYDQRPDGRAPDLILGYNAGFRVSWQTALGEAPDGDVLADNLGKWSGDHCCDASVVPGVFLCNQGGLAINPNVRDILPLIMDFLS
jgi:predicted AlkP superfamily phosphohydrolase/phosphomutase